ncbi:hypothetical protein [Streptomyces sp. NPDC021020]|uniref:hypothetical protein n=1 Tax=Streptomyces sp. NPDC021020 TaxID=3365109 RepID=UPI0037AB9B68
MPRLTCFAPATDGGQDLLDRHIAPIAAGLGAELRVVRPPADRREGMRAELGRTDVTIWDASLEDERGVYDAMTMWTKLRRKNVIVSRTPLPRNVLTWHQFAPVHGSTFRNDEIGAWLARHLAARFGVPLPEPPSGGPSPAGHYWMYDRPAEHFMSFRGTHQQAAEAWRDAFQREHGTTVRMVPPSEFSYPTEVVTRAQMWEGVARLQREIEATSRILVYLTGDYADSFWCAGELMCAAYMLLHTQGVRLGRLPRIADAQVVVPGVPGTTPLTRAAADGLLRLPDHEQVRRLTVLLTNCDPVSAAPESRIAPTGPARPLSRVLRRWGFYDPEVVQEHFWSRVRVPCPRCAPHGRAPDALDWDAFLRAPEQSGGGVDAFGYFDAPQDGLAAGRVGCPGCGRDCRLVNRRGVRTLWMPLLTTEKDRDRPVVVRTPVWEVVADG